MTTIIDRTVAAPAASDAVIGGPPATSADTTDPFAAQVGAVERWMAQPRFDGLVRLHTARDVAEQQGSIPVEHAVARESAQAFYELLRKRFAERGRITTFGPYTPGQAVTMKRRGLEAIYLGGWATSAKGSADEDPGPDLASYPLSAVPEEAAGIVRALLTADRDQHFRRSRLPAGARATTPRVDYRPFIIADADTGHGGDAHVRNLIRRFVEVGVPGYHIEDQRPGAKKCGHQDGKVLVSQAEQNKRLNAARLQLDIMRVPGIIVARTDAEAATLLDDASDERDQPFVLGATRRDLPSYRVGYLAILRLLHEAGLAGIRGHLLAAVPEAEHRAAVDWLAAAGIVDGIRERVAMTPVGDDGRPGEDGDAVLAEIEATFAAAWSSAAGLATFDEAVADVLERRVTDGEASWSDLDAWRGSSGTRSFAETRAAARAMGLDVEWDPDLPRTPDGFYRVAGGIDYAIAKSLAAAPFSDLLWMETKTADLADARRFAEAIHAVHPGKMIAYNLSPSFNWDTTGMTDDEMRAFPDALGRLGFVFQFITYGGHQIDGLVTEDFAVDLRRDGMLALARLQRRLRLIDSPYRAPQALVGGPRLDAALMAASGRTASTAAMGARSTHHQHLVSTEIDVSVLRGWLAAAQAAGRLSTGVEVSFGPTNAQSERTLLALRPAMSPGGSSLVSVVVPSAPRTLVVESVSAVTAGEDAAGMALALLFLLGRERPDRLVGLDPVLADHPAIRRLAQAGALGPIAASPGGITVASVDSGCVARLAELTPEVLVEAVLPD